MREEKKMSKCEQRTRRKCSINIYEKSPPAFFFFSRHVKDVMIKKPATLRVYRFLKKPLVYFTLKDSDESAHSWIFHLTLICTILAAYIEILKVHLTDTFLIFAENIYPEWRLPYTAFCASVSPFKFSNTTWTTDGHFPNAARVSKLKPFPPIDELRPFSPIYANHG